MEHWKSIMKHLYDKGLQVYAPGSHKGDVDEPYVVVKPLNSDKYINFSTTIRYYDVMYYGRTVTECEELRIKAEFLMKDLQPTIMPTYSTTEPFYDDTVKGWMSSSMYRNYRKIEN